MATKPPFDFADLSRRLGEIKFPEIDWQELMAAQQKNWEALGQAGKVWSEGTRKVVQREVEILQNALAEAAAASKEILQEGDARAPDDAAQHVAADVIEAEGMRHRRSHAAHAAEDLRVGIGREQVGDDCQDQQHADEAQADDAGPVAHEPPPPARPLGTPGRAAGGHGRRGDAHGAAHGITGSGSAGR